MVDFKMDFGPTTHEHLVLGKVAIGKTFLDLLLRDEANTTLPVRRRVVQHIVNLEPIGVPRRELVELGAEQDVLDVDVRVDEVQLGLVPGVLECGADDLEHGRDTGTASDHADLLAEGRVVFELALGTLDADLVADFEEGDVSGDVAFLVRLYACRKWSDG